MNANAVNVAVVDGKTITQTVELSTVKNGQPIRIKAVQGGHYILGEGEKGIAPENITIKRVGKDLHVALEGSDPDQPQLIIEDFEGSGGQLVGIAEDGSYYPYISSDAEQDRSAAFLIEGVDAPQVLGSQELAGFGNGLVAGSGIGWFWPALLGLGALGLLGGIYAATRDDDKDNNHNVVAPAPNTPFVGGATDNVGDEQGPITKGGSTDDTTPTFTGTGTPGNTIIIRDNGKPIGEAIVGDDGKWSFTPTTPLPEGSHSIIVVEKDKDGNISKPSDEFDFIVDITAPGKSSIDGITDDFGPQHGEIARNGLTDDNTPTLRGKAEPGSTLEIYANGIKIGETTVNPDGSWSYTPSPALADGTYEFTTVAKDAAGNVGLPSDPYIIIVDTDGPGKPGIGTGGIEEALDNVGTIIGDIGNGGVTDDDTPTFSGGGLNPGDKVTIIDGGVVIGEVIVGEDGRWEFTPDPALSEGPHPITVVVTDPLDRVSEPSDPYIVIVDKTPPAKPGAGTGGIEEAIDNVGPITGDIGNGGTTDDGTPTIGGVGLVPGDKVTIIDGGVVIGETIVKDDGSWEFTPNPALVDGPHPITVIVTDPAGNASEPSDPYIIIVDTLAPPAPTIDSVIDDQGATTGPINPGDTTDDAQPVISGTAEAGSTVIIYDNGVEIGRTTANPDRSWNFTPVPPLLNGPHDLTAKAEDTAGNISDPSNNVDFDLVAGGSPPAPAITGVTDDVADDLGNIMPGESTNDTQPEVTGTAAHPSTVTLYANGVAVGTANTIDASGRWSIIPNPPLPEGLTNLTATATNAAGNESAPTGEYPINVDTTPPAAADASVLEDNVGPITDPITSGDTTDDNTPTFSGTAEPNTTLIIYDNGVEIGRVPVDGSGNWNFTPAPPLTDGAHSFSTEVVDNAGNRSPQSTPIDFTVDTSAVAISIEQVLDNVGPNQDPLASGSVTDDSTPTLTGQATPGSTVNIYLDGVLHQAGVPVSALGRWEYTFAPPLAEGNYVFNASVVTPAGGESPLTGDFNLEVDLTPSAAPTIDEIRDDVGAIQDPLADGATTDDTTPTLAGTGVAGDTIIIRNNGVEIGRATVQPDNSWSFTPNPPLNNGSTNEFDVIAQDPAGNQSAPSAPWTIIIDTDAPTTSAVVESMGKDSGTDSGDFVTNDGSAGRLIQGSLTAALVAGEKVQVSTDGGATWLDVLINADDTWNFIDKSSHAGDWTIQTRVVDAAGNNNTTSQSVSLDSVAPATPNSVFRNGDFIEVEFDSTNLSVGDKVNVLIGEYRFDYELTEADLVAGEVSLAIPADIIAEVGASVTYGAAIVDQTGNVSSYLSRIILEEDFSTATPVNLAVNESASTGILTLTNDGGSVSAGWPTGFVDGASHSSRHGVGILAQSDFTVALDGGATATRVRFNMLDSQAPHTIIFYNDAGDVVHTHTTTQWNAGAPSEFLIEIDMPPGISFSSFQWDMSLILGVTDSIVIDNLSFENSGFEVSPLANQEVNNGGGTYFGGGENNVFSISDVSNLNNLSGIKGNAGVDTLSLTGADQALDLGAIAGKLESIEIIDLTGTGNNTLNLSLGDVLELGEGSLFTTDETVQMVVKGNAGDVVNLDDLLGDGTDPGDWAGMGQVTVEGVTYNVFQHSNLDAQLLVQDGVTTNLV
ncbi:Ig-like domain-containing protein [Pseudomonas sp. NPDC098747]|uniref:Ig-like domain-containing protein n=1 Tax=Pseudomonas sp. NPDC098747 TaxID=3364487 RepID=UPI00383A251B